MNLLSLSHISKTYTGGVHAVEDLSFELGNELLVLMGPSGSGKSTTLRMIAGLELPTEGVISMAGQSVNNVPARRRGVAMVFQQGALYPHLTARGNMEFGLRMRRVPGDERNRRVTGAAKALNITGLLERHPRELSGGEQQRVALGRAIVQQPKLFLLDEPLSSLNAGLRRQLRQTIRDLQSRLATPMIHVTHDPQEAMALGTRIAFLRAGRLQQIGTPMELYSNPSNRSVAEGLDSPGMNFLDGLVERCNDSLEITIDDQRFAAAASWCKILESRVGQHIVIGVRPQHILFESAGNKDAGFRMTLSVLAVENIGGEKQMTLISAGQTLIARSSLSCNGQVIVSAADENVYLFDATNGARIRNCTGAD